jgi:hypothetical protein
MIVSNKYDYNINYLDIPKDGKGDIDYQKSFIATLTIIVRDKDGKIIKKYKQKSHSPTANFIGLMLPLKYFSETGNPYILTSTSNTTLNYKPSISNASNGINYPNNYGGNKTYLVNIIVGSGSNSNPYSAYNLSAPISNGSGAGQLLYGSLELPTSVAINGSQAYFIISQVYYNQSGGTITISEVGIVIYLGINSIGTLGNTLVWYDTLSSPISVGSGQNIVIYYTFSVNA